MFSLEVEALRSRLCLLLLRLTPFFSACRSIPFRMLAGQPETRKSGPVKYFLTYVRSSV